jgi:peptide/nickel transport system ATP-binding protein
MALLEVDDLTVTFRRQGRQPVNAVDGVSFTVDAGQSVGLVGESGCGKSVTSLAIMQLLPRRGVDVGGQARFAGQNLFALGQNEMRDIRGRDLAMVFQDPMTSLNPVLTVGLQITEVLERHQGVTKGEAKAEAERLLHRVGIPDPGRRLGEYPHQLSGGMRQRVMIAIALACRPRLLIADEPTTALDVTIQAQILELLRLLIEDTGAALVMITHDLGVVAGLCDTVHVMYAGRIVESAPRHELFASPSHPYTNGLLGSIPRLDDARGEPLRPIRGSANDALPWTKGCAFAPRCTYRTPECVQGPPATTTIDARHTARCIHPVLHEPTGASA